MIRNPIQSSLRVAAALVHRAHGKVATVLALFALSGSTFHLGAASQSFTAFAPGGAEVVITRDGADYLRFGTAVWGPNWAWTSVEGKIQKESGAAVGSLTTKLAGTPVRLDFRAARTAPNTLQLSYELKAERDTDLTLFVVELAPGPLFSGREAVVQSRGTVSKVPIPFGKRTFGEAVTELRLTAPDGAPAILRFDPPCEIAADGAARVILAKERLKAEPSPRLSITLELPGPTEWFPTPADVPDEPGIETWYPWTASGSGDSVWSMADWLEKPAGKHGRITRNGEHLLYHGQPIKLWGINLCYGATAPEKALADKRAALYPRYGINAVRLHKFADGTGWSGIQSKASSAEYDPAGLDRMDYQVAKLKQAGIYTKLSPHFGTIKIGPADRRDVPFMDEFGTLAAGKDRVSAPHSAFFYSPELQALHTRQMTNLLAHRNPYTGLTYAEDPAICAIEIINEQSILFYTSMAPLQQSPTLRRQVAQRFSDWLRRKYTNHDGLLKAWGSRALDGFEKDGFPAGEHLDKNNLLPLGNPWYWDPDQFNGPQAYRKQRLLDTLQFLYQLQCEAYDRYVVAVRKAGYGGEILGSNWQAGRANSHFANLHSDALIGLIDRHNYFGGGGGGGGKFNNASMLARPGSGVLSSGLQQVDDRPFMLSEWIHVFPNEWGVEGPATIGAYAMGLQGWDVSFLFQNGDNAAFSSHLGNQWDVMVPQILGVFPAVSRQVLRGDVKPSEVTALRNVHMPSLFEGKLGFDDQVVQGYDDKELDSATLPAAALAAVRCAVRFTDTWPQSPAFNLKPYRQDGFIVSSTGQLRWKETAGSKNSGFFTMNTEATRAVAGFAQSQPCRLGDVTITPQSRFSAIYLTALSKAATLNSGGPVLLVAMARARNSGMKFSGAGDDLLERGKGPVLVEPVKATFEFAGKTLRAVQILDHDGRPTGKSLPIANGRFSIDGAVEKTPYYLLEF